MDGRPYENYYTTETHQRRMQNPGPLSRPVTSFLSGFDGEHLAICFVSAVVMYGAGYIIARLFYSGIMFFLAVGLIIFFVMQIVDGVDRSVRDYNKVLLVGVNSRRDNLLNKNQISSIMHEFSCIKMIKSGSGVSNI